MTLYLVSCAKGREIFLNVRDLNSTMTRGEPCQCVGLISLNHKLLELDIHHGRAPQSTHHIGGDDCGPLSLSKSHMDELFH